MENLNGLLDSGTVLNGAVISKLTVNGQVSIGRTFETIPIEDAEVGQIAQISEVDDNGKPTAWEAVDIPEGFTSIKPFPNNAVGKYNTLGTDVFQLEDKVCYIWDEVAAGKSGALLAVADDGTVKTITTLGKGLYSVQVAAWASQINIISENIKYSISTADKSTANAIVVTAQYNQKYLDIMANKEFVPTLDYQPATKKYVDDSVSTTVKSVNGTVPDANGNVQLETGSSFGDADQIEMLIEADMLPAVHDASGAILTDENGNIILRY